MPRFIKVSDLHGGGVHHVNPDHIDFIAPDGTGCRLYFLGDRDGLKVEQSPKQVLALIEGEAKVTPATMADLVAVADEMANELDSIADQLERVGDTRAHRDGQYINDARAVLERWEAVRWPASKESV